MSKESWHDVGSAAELSQREVTEVTVGKTRLALSFKDEVWGVVSGVCNHVGGPLGQGHCDGDYLVCPWHSWKFHRCTGLGEPGYEEDAVPRHEVKVVDGRVLVNLTPASPHTRKPHPAHPLARAVNREPGEIRVVGISTTVMDPGNPRYSTSEALLEVGIEHAKSLGHETKLIKLRDLKFRSCEGYYSKSARACTWPCSITQADPTDELTPVYDAIVHWADVILLATPIRWGQASSLYFKMAERLNCVQNQITIANKELIQKKVAGFIITGGQDNIQGVAGQMMAFFTELGFHLPQFPFVAHSRGWTAEDMEKNIAEVRQSEELRQGTRELTERAIETASLLLGCPKKDRKPSRGGRKAHRLEVERSAVAGPVNT